MEGISSVAKKISRVLVKKEIIPEEEEGLYCYGIENGIVVAVNILTSVLVGAVTGRLDVIIIFLLFYATLRSYSGGIHCRNRLACYLCSTLVLFLPVYSYHMVMEVIPETVWVTVFVVSFLVIFIFSPVESPNKKLDREERQFFRRAAHCIAGIQICMMVVLYCAGAYRYFCAGYTSIVISALLMVLGKVFVKYYT